MDNDADLDTRPECRRNHIRPLSSSMMRAPSWSSGFGADSRDDKDSQDDVVHARDSSAPNVSDCPQSNESGLVWPTTTIEIPTVYLARHDQATSPFHVYQLHIKTSTKAEWSVYKRYSQFLKFHHKIRQLEPEVKKFTFPPKRRLNSRASTIVQERRRKLEDYIQRVSDLAANLPMGSESEDYCHRLNALSSKGPQQVLAEPDEVGPVNDDCHSEQEEQESDHVDTLNGVQVCRAEEAPVHASQIVKDIPVSAEEQKSELSAKGLFYHFITHDSFENKII